MTKLRRLLSLPLLVKELTESSARRRTYGARVLFALGLYGFVALLLPRSFWQPDATVLYGSFSHLGIGRSIFESFVVVQCVGVTLFLPAMMCGSITQEKERDSLVLLLLTELRPWQILLQKYLGGLVPVLSFVLLGVPLMAVAYSLGGVQDVTLIEQSIGIVLVVLQLGALTLLCSAWCRTTVGALLSSYFLGALMYVAPPLFWFSIVRSYGSFGERVAFLLAPPALLEITSGDRLGIRVLELLPCVLSILLFLGLARFFFLRRAFVPRSDFLRRTFRRLDAFMQRANRLTGGVMIVRESSSLPGDSPIYWRETRTRALGRPHHLVRLLVVAESLTLLTCLLIFWNHDGTGELIAVFGSLVLLVVAVQSANVIVSERVNQTLEVLLTTPLTAAQIVREKERALFRLLLVLATPLVTVFGLEYYMAYDLPTESAKLSLVILSASLLAVAIYLPMVAWLAMTIGLWMRTRFRAIIVTLIILVTWCLLPLIVAEEIDDRPVVRTSLIPVAESRRMTKDFCKLFSPLGVVIFSHSGETRRPWDFELTWQLVVMNFACYGAVAVGLRTLLVWRCDHWLRRP